MRLLCGRLDCLPIGCSAKFWFLGVYGRSVIVPGKLLAPGPGRSAEALIAVDEVDAMQNVFASVMFAATPTVIAPAGVPCVRMSCTKGPAFEQTPPVPQSEAAAQPFPVRAPALQ